MSDFFELDNYYKFLKFQEISFPGNFYHIERTIFLSCMYDLTIAKRHVTYKIEQKKYEKLDY